MDTFVLLTVMFTMVIVFLIVIPSINRAGSKTVGPRTRAPRRAVTPEEQRRIEDGFMPLSESPIVLTNHAIERYRERLSFCDLHTMNQDAEHAYLYGKTALQVPKTTASRLIDIENRHETEHEDPIIALLYANRIYIFTDKNVLVTLYPNSH